jgi:hypothetical protein
MDVLSWRVSVSAGQLLSGSNSAVECQLPKLDVAGSIPVSRSMFSMSYIALWNHDVLENGVNRSNAAINALWH